MAKKSLYKTLYRTERVQFRLSVEERAELSRVAERFQLDSSNLGRILLFDGLRRVQETGVLPVQARPNEA